MKVRLLKDWSWHKSGDVADVFEPLGRNWINSGIAEAFTEPKAVPAERAVVDGEAETAMVSPRKSQPRKQ